MAINRRLFSMSEIDVFSAEGCFVAPPETFTCSVCGSSELVVTTKDDKTILVCLNCSNYQYVPVILPTEKNA